MFKKELVKNVSEKTLLEENFVSKVVDATLAAIKDTVSAGEKVELKNFGNFEILQTKEKIGRNPRTGEKITVPAQKRPVFRPSKNFKDEVNQASLS